MTSDYEIEEGTVDSGLVEETQEFSILSAIGAQNITEYFDDQRLQEIGATVVREYEIDEGNFQKRKDRIEELYKLALQVKEQKNYPFQNASNIKYPLLTKAALGFASMAYPSIVQDEKVVKGKVVGSDEGTEEVMGPDGEPLVDEETGKPLKKNAGLKKKTADRISEFMSHQVLETMDGWEDDMDKILHIIPIVGCAFKKTYHDPIDSVNVSRLVLPQFLTINIDASSVEKANRVSELVQLYPHEIEENIRLGVFRAFDYTQSTETLADNYKETEDSSAGQHDNDMPHVFIEQHRRLDLDGDGYAEPYIVWVHKQSNQVCRILARYDEEDVLLSENQEIVRIKPQSYYIKFGFIPDPEGSPYDIGFGHLVQHLNVAANTSINQMIDQGHMYTLGAGFIGEGLRVKSGNMRFRPNEWKRVKTGGGSVRENVVPLPTKEPSTVLMALLQFLINAAEEMTTMARVMAGDIPANMPATTALASMEQGLQPFKAVFKRVHRALKKEFKRLFYLNGLYLTQEEYNEVLDDPSSDVGRDFLTGVADVVPVSDPEIITNLQSMMRAQALLEMKDDPLLDGVEVRKRALKAMNIKDVDDLVKIPPQSVDEVAEAQKAALQAQVMDLQSKIQERTMDARRKDMELGMEIEKSFVEAKKIYSEAIKNLAEAESEEEGRQLDVYKTYVDHLARLKEEVNAGRQAGTSDDPRGMGDMEVQPGNGEVF